MFYLMTETEVCSVIRSWFEIIRLSVSGCGLEKENPGDTLASSLVDWLIDWLTGWLIDWLTGLSLSGSSVAAEKRSNVCSYRSVSVPFWLLLQLRMEHQPGMDGLPSAFNTFDVTFRNYWKEKLVFHLTAAWFSKASRSDLTPRTCEVSHLHTNMFLLFYF